MRRELPIATIAAIVAVLAAVVLAAGWYRLSRRAVPTDPPVYTPDVPAWAQGQPGPPLPTTIGGKG